MTCSRCNGDFPLLSCFSGHEKQYTLSLTDHYKTCPRTSKRLCKHCTQPREGSAWPSIIECSEKQNGYCWTCNHYLFFCNECGEGYSYGREKHTCSRPIKYNPGRTSDEAFADEEYKRNVAVYYEDKRSFEEWRRENSLR